MRLRVDNYIHASPRDASNRPTDPDAKQRVFNIGREALKREHEKKDMQQARWELKYRGREGLTERSRELLRGAGLLSGGRDSAYSEFISSGGKPADWEKHAAEQNRISKERGSERIIQAWRGSGVPGNDIVNLLRSRGISTPSSILNALQHNDTTVSSTGVQGRGMNRSEAAKIHQWVSEQMQRL